MGHVLGHGTFGTMSQECPMSHLGGRLQPTRHGRARRRRRRASTSQVVEIGRCGRECRSINSRRRARSASVRESSWQLSETVAPARLRRAPSFPFPHPTERRAQPMRARRVHATKRTISVPRITRIATMPNLAKSMPSRSMALARMMAAGIRET
jgi:hypothetical protein